MAGLFNVLLNKRQIDDKTPLEDFFTEIFAFILNNYEELFRNWIREFIIKKNNLEISDIEEIEIIQKSVQTQITFKALKEDYTASRPDIYIKVQYNNDKSDIIFIESKIGSSEGEEQLQRYAEHLDYILNNNTDICHSTLVYITRDYDKKYKSSILVNCNNMKRLNFVQLRWYEVYRFLENYKENDIFTREILKFMKENNMSLNNQFSPVDIITITNFPSVNKMMDETMFYSIIYEEFKKITGCSRPTPAYGEWKNKNRYIYYYSQKENMWCGLGYFFDPEEITNYPEVGIILAIPPNLSERNKIIKNMKNKTAWKVKDIKSWTELYYTKSLREFLPCEDHIEVIKEFLVKSLRELTIIKEEYPELPWNK